MNGGVAYTVETAVDGGSGLLIFVLQAGQSRHSSGLVSVRDENSAGCGGFWKCGAPRGFKSPLSLP
jgi:hypothetical protein